MIKYNVCFAFALFLLSGVLCRTGYTDSVPKFSDIVRTADGSIHYMNQDSAIQYCANQGMHLPSARELAQLSASMGAAGISETPKDGYLVSAKNADGKVDNFYFSYVGYKRPTGDLNIWFWSSSVNSYYSDMAYFLNGDDGVINYDGCYFPSAVRCVVGH